MAEGGHPSPTRDRARRPRIQTTTRPTRRLLRPTGRRRGHRGHRRGGRAAGGGDHPPIRSAPRRQRQTTTTRDDSAAPPVPTLGGSGAPVAESALAPPGPIPNPVVTQRSAGEYCGGDPTGGEAAAGAPDPRETGGHGAPRANQRSRAGHRTRPPRGGAAAARWAHNPKVGGSNPPPATNRQRGHPSNRMASLHFSDLTSAAMS